MSGAGRRGWAVVTAASGTVLIGCGAFWLSFTALADLAARSGIGTGQAWIWPLLVDGLIVVATVAVVALDRQAAAWYPWALLIAGALVSVTANAAHALVAAETTVPGVLAGTVAAVPPLVLLASTHLTVVLTRPTHAPGEPPTETPRVETSSPLLAVPAIATPERPESASLDARASTDGDPAAPAAEAAEPGSALALDDADPSAPEASEGSGRRERAARLREAGWSNKQIARALDVHPSTVGRWMPRPPEPDPPEMSRPEPAGSPASSGPDGAGIPPDLTQSPDPTEEEPS
jgi:hypothetical protein